MHSILYAANTAPQNALASGSYVDPGVTIRRTGCACGVRDNAILCSGTGYYRIDASFAAVPSATDSVTITAYRDGVAIPGAVATFTASVRETIPMSFVIRNTCCSTSSLITFQVATVIPTTTVSVSNVATVVEKI